MGIEGKLFGVKTSMLDSHICEDEQKIAESQKATGYFLYHECGAYKDVYSTNIEDYGTALVEEQFHESAISDVGSVSGMSQMSSLSKLNKSASRIR
jgi:hypothetical protein